VSTKSGEAQSSDQWFSPQQPIPITTILTASISSQSQSRDGEEMDDNMDAVMRSNYFAATCAFISASFLVVLGIIRWRK
jgi:hypothetical protein